MFNAEEDLLAVELVCRAGAEEREGDASPEGEERLDLKPLLLEHKYGANHSPNGFSCLSECTLSSGDMYFKMRPVQRASCRDLPSEGDPWDARERRWPKAKEPAQGWTRPCASGALAARRGSRALGKGSAGNRGTLRRGDVNNRLLLCLSWGQAALAAVRAGDFSESVVFCAAVDGERRAARSVSGLRAGGVSQHCICA